MNTRTVFKNGRPAAWTPERIAQMTVQEIKQLRENAERLNHAEVVTLCSDALQTHAGARRGGPSRAASRTKARTLVPRTKAFEARGVYLEDARTSWGGVRKADGAVVLALWADAIESSEGGCRYLLWQPNVDGSRPWSDKAAGRERLEHCKKAIQLGSAEGLLVYGERVDGQLPEEKAFAIHGVDSETVVSFTVQKDGESYWAVWGKKSGTGPLGGA